MRFVNDFTKEELQIILLDMDTYINKAVILKVPKHHLELRDKVESMIDNYDKPCEHKHLRRVSLIDGHEYDICHHCPFIRQVR